MAEPYYEVVKTALLEAGKKVLGLAINLTPVAENVDWSFTIEVKTPTGFFIDVGVLTFPSPDQMQMQKENGGWQQFSLRFTHAGQAAGEAKDRRIRFVSITPGSERAPWFALIKEMDKPFQ